MGFNVVERTTKIYNFAYGDLMMWAPMAALTAYEIWHWSVAVSLGFAALVTIALSLIVEFLALRPYLNQASSLGWILSGLGASLVLEQAAGRPFHSEQVSFPIAVSATPITIGAIHISAQSILIVSMTAFFYLALKLFYRTTAIGKMLIATGEDSDGAQVLGISQRRMSQVSVIIAGLVALSAGLACAPIFLVYPTLGFSITFLGFVAVAIGGIGSIDGALIGGLIVGWVGAVVSAYWNSIWTDMVLFGLLLLVYLIRPTGLLGHRPLRAV
jgi:branched-chain amino acid transport system permease protein